jgi:uncharacterized protein (DUF2147 family)
MKLSRMAFAVALMSTGMVPAVAGDPTGVWVSENGDTKVRVSRCGGSLCGSLAWLREPNDPSGRPKTDKHNPDLAKRDRRLIGVPVLFGMKPEGEDRWSGRIYNADDGKTYASRVMLASAGSMKVQGCVLGGLFCKSMTWTRTN